MRIRPWIAVIAAFAVAGGPSPLRAAAPEPIRIPVVLSLTGSGAFVGKDEAQDLQFIESMVNRSGGIDHHPVHFDVTDDTSNGQVAVQLVNGIVAQKAPVFLGPTLTQDCNAVGPVVREHGPLEYCFSPGIRPAAGGYIFSSSVGLEDCAKVLIRYFRLRGFTRLAVLTATDATGQEMDRDFELARSLKENKNVEFVSYQHFNLSDVSVAAQMARIKAAKPQALLTWTVGPAFGTILHGAADGDLGIPIGASNGVMVVAQLAQYRSFMPKELDFVGVLTNGPETLAKGPVHDAQTKYLATFKAAGVKPDFPHTLAWDPALMIIDAYRHIGAGATTQQLREYLNALHGWAGINGIYDFRDGSQRGIGDNAALIARWDSEHEQFVSASKRGGYLK